MSEPLDKKEWDKQFESGQIHADAKMLDEMKAAKPSWADQMKPVLQSVVAQKQRVAEATRTAITQNVSPQTTPPDNPQIIKLVLCNGTVIGVHGFIITPAP